MDRAEFVRLAGSSLLGIYGLGNIPLLEQLGPFLPVTFQVDDQSVNFTNGDGTWTIWTKPTRDPETGAVVGPGYIGRMVRPDGTMLVDDYFHSDINTNDPRTGGLGSFGVQLGRRNEFYPDPDEIYNYTWNLTERINAHEGAGLGVCATRILDGPRLNELEQAIFVIENDLSDIYSYPLPILRVRRNYQIDVSSVKCATRVTMMWDGNDFPLFIKEPKIVAHSLGGADSRSPQYRYLEVFAQDGKRIRKYDLWQLPDPTVKTLQLRMGDRFRLRFSDTRRSQFFNVIGATTDGNSVIPWKYASYGFDQWAQNMNERERFVAECNSRYCLQGPSKRFSPEDAPEPTLSRNWEATRWASGKAGSPPDPERPQVGVMFHAWEGGTGYPDCLCASRAMELAGTSYTVWSCYSYDSGWAN